MVSVYRDYVCNMEGVINMLEMVVAIIVFGTLLGLIVKGLTDKEQTCKQYSLLSNPAFAMYNEGKEVKAEKAENDTSYVLHPMGKMVH